VVGRTSKDRSAKRAEVDATREERRGERAIRRFESRVRAVGATPSGGSAGDARAGGWGRSRHAAYLSQML